MAEHQHDAAVFNLDDFRKAADQIRATQGPPSWQRLLPPHMFVTMPCTNCGKTLNFPGFGDPGESIRAFCDLACESEWQER